MRTSRKRTLQKTVLQQALSRSRTAFLSVAVFSFFLNLLMLATPLYMLQVFSRVLSSGHVPTLFYLTLVTIFALLILGLLSMIRSWILLRISSWLSTSLSGPLITASLSNTLSGNTTGAQPLRDLGQIQSFIGGMGITALFDAPWVPIFIGAIWLMHPWLGIVALTSAIVLFVLALINEMTTREPQHDANREQAKAYQLADSSIRNAEAIHAMGMMPGLLAKWDKMNSSAMQLQGMANSRSATILGLSKFIRLSVQVSILGAGAMLVIRSELTPGQMIAASILLSRALSPVEQSIAGWRTFIAARTSYERLQNLMRAWPESPTSTSLPVPEGLLEVENVSFAPPAAEKPILVKVSFSLSPGEMLGVVGPTGAGKSTLIRLLMGIWAPTVGTVRLDSADVHTWNREEFGRYVGYLPQDVGLFSGTVRENIARLGDASDQDVIQAAQMADAHEMILRLPNGYDTVLGDGGIMLSAGQRQRIGLARALLRQPRLVVLDEPNTALDREGEAALLKTLRALKESGTTIIMVVHRTNMLENVDKLLFMYNGKLAAFGEKEIVLNYINSLDNNKTTESENLRTEERVGNAQ